MLTGLVINEIKIAGNHRMQIRQGMHARQIAVACHPVVVVDEEQIFAFCIVYTDIPDTPGRRLQCTVHIRTRSR